MTHKFHHEQLYRGADVAAKLASVRITLCGVGALGSNLADTLARQGFSQLRVIDRDRIEEHNVSTQTYGESDVGAWKVDVLRNQIFRSVGVEIEGINKELTARTAAKFLKDSDIVLDTFDNSASRALVQAACREARLRCLHVGLFADYGEVTGTSVIASRATSARMRAIIPWPAIWSYLPWRSPRKRCCGRWRRAMRRTGRSRSAILRFGCGNTDAQIHVDMPFAPQPDRSRLK